MQEKQYIKDKVTAVIPVYNEERFLRQCLESVVDQVDCIILGDNASTDGTEEICREFAKKYDHVVYFRNEINLGSVENSLLCYEKVETEFLFHIGGHDLIPKNYIYRLKETLHKNPDAVIAYTNTIQIDKNDKTVKFWDRFDLNLGTGLDSAVTFAELFADDAPSVRVSQFIMNRSPCNIIFGLMRSSLIVPNIRSWCPIMCGPDDIFLFNLLLEGKGKFCSRTSFLRREFRDKDSPEAYMERITGRSHNDDYCTGIIKLTEMFIQIYTGFIEKNRVEDSQKFIQYLQLRKAEALKQIVNPHKTQQADRPKASSNIVECFRKPLKGLEKKFKLGMAEIFNKRILRENQRLQDEIKKYEENNAQMLDYLVQVFNEDIEYTNES